MENGWYAMKLFSYESWTILNDLWIDLRGLVPPKSWDQKVQSISPSIVSNIFGQTGFTINFFSNWAIDRPYEFIIEILSYSMDFLTRIIESLSKSHDL